MCRRLCFHGSVSVCLGLLCILLLACVITQHVMYTIAGKVQLESIQNMTLQRDDLVKALSEVNININTGWWYYNSSVYYISTRHEKMKWWQSRQYCKSRNADLVIINSVEEQTFISKLTTTCTPEVWVGLADKDHTRVMKWLDGSPLTIGFWSPEQHTILENKFCVTIRNYPPIDTWQTNSCDSKLNFICEKNIFK